MKTIKEVLTELKSKGVSVETAKDIADSIMQLNAVKKIVRENPNDRELGTKIRKLF